MEHYFNTIVISGKIASGKTTLAKRLVTEFNAEYISFGEYIRNEATKQGYKLSRENLQNLGEYLINKNGYYNFVLNVFNYFTNPFQSDNKIIVIEGVRHVDILKEIKKISRTNITIFLDIEKNQLCKNIEHRDSFDSQTLNRFLEHNIEAGVIAIKEHADITLTSLFTENDIFYIKNFISSKM